MIRKVLLACVAAAVAAGSAAAGLLPVAVTISPENNNYRWTYAIVLPTDMKLEAGNYFTIYDFQGYKEGGQKSPEGWTFSAESRGPTPDRLRPNDDPGIVNLTWTYNGETIPSGQIGLGNFWAVSEFRTRATDSFTANTARTSDGLLDSNITETEVPIEPNTIPPDPNTVPEPATLLLAGLGLPIFGAARALRRRAR